MTNKKIAILASGNGTNAEKFFDYFKSHPQIRITCLLSNNGSAYALTRARKNGIQSMIFGREEFYNSTDVISYLAKREVTDIVLAGFMWLVPANILDTFRGHIYNIHPALLPKFGGKGMFGDHVHRAVIAAGEKDSGITIHKVNEKYDEGSIIFQAKCPVMGNDTPESLASRIHELEYAHYPRIVESCVLGKDAD